MMRRVLAAIVWLQLIGSGSALAVDLEPARDALRRHEYERAVGLLRPLSEAGDSEASFQLSQLLRYGRGVARDLPKACQLLEGSAIAGHARAAGSLAAMLESGECTKSTRTADEWRQAARSAGYAPPAASTNQPESAAASTPEHLLRAARSGDLPLVQRLLDSQPIDVTDEFGRTPTMLAIDGGYLAVVRELVGRGASLAAADRNGETPLLLAVRNGNSELLSFLLDRGAPVNAANDSGMTPLMLAALAGSRDLCDRLLAAGADPRLPDADGLRAGDHAARGGHTDLALRLGVDAKRQPAGPVRSGALQAGQTKLMIAAEGGDQVLLRQRLAASDDKNATDAQGMTALAFAARAGEVAAVETLLAAGAAVDVRDRAGWTALAHSVRSGQVEAARRLLHGGADPGARLANGKPLLLVAIESNDADLVRMLVDAGADPNTGDKDGIMPLMAAASKDDIDSIRVLLAAGARPDRVDTHKRAALWYAASQDAPRAVAALAPRSALNAADDNGATPLAAAVSRGHRKAVDALLAAGADTRVKTANGNSILHIAAASGEAALILLLVAARVPVDSVNSHGDTPLMLGVKARCLACAKNLIAASASTRLRNVDGLTALDIARLSTDKALIELLD